MSIYCEFIKIKTDNKTQRFLRYSIYNIYININWYIYISWHLYYNIIYLKVHYDWKEYNYSSCVEIYKTRKKTLCKLHALTHLMLINCYTIL